MILHTDKPTNNNQLQNEWLEMRIMRVQMTIDWIHSFQNNNNNKNSDYLIIYYSNRMYERTRMDRWQRKCVAFVYLIKYPSMLWVAWICLWILFYLLVLLLSIRALFVLKIVKNRKWNRILCKWMKITLIIFKIWQITEFLRFCCIFPKKNK